MFKVKWVCKCLVVVGLLPLAMMMACAPPGAAATGSSSRQAASPPLAPVTTAVPATPAIVVGSTPVPADGSVQIEGNRVIGVPTPAPIAGLEEQYAAATAAAGKLDRTQRPRRTSSPDQVGQYAVDYAVANGKAVPGNPKVALARPVGASELESLGLGKINYPDNVPLMLVIMRGDLDMKGSVGAAGSEVAQVKPKRVIRK